MIIFGKPNMYITDVFLHLDSEFQLLANGIHLFNYFGLALLFLTQPAILLFLGASLINRYTVNKLFQKEKKVRTKRVEVS